MNDEAISAFAPLGQGAGPNDRISLRDYVRPAEIGAFQPERGAEQRLRINIVVDVSPLGASAGDNVDRILSYDALVEAVDATLASERLNLLETFAERVAARILTEPAAHRVHLRVEKLDRGPFALGVEIVREALRAATPVAVTTDAPRPRLVYLSNAAIADPGLADWLDRAEHPLVLCVGPGDGAPPLTSSPAAARRIALLAIEQNAWVLAGRDRRCIVVDSRTETQWAMRAGRVTVWAPSKIVLDAGDSPAGSDARVLAAWWARELHATELVMVGVEAPEPDASRAAAPGAAVAMRSLPVGLWP